ncbi:MAG: T9SS type A sorting domain-containing protein, partial [Bacteroidia bacterium]
SSSPRALTLAGSKLFMFAFDSLAGTEIHSLNIRGISLPVEDLEVFGQYEGSAVKLDWNTVHEHNTQYFEVQRSQDRVLFNTVGRVGASGTYEGKLAYAFTDVDPLPGTSFYRLKLVDVDGTFIHSSVIEVFENKEVTLDWKIAGNPVQNKLLRVKGSAFTGLLQLSVYDLNGKMLWKQDVQSGARSAEFQLPAQMASGMYILQIENQFKKIQQRFICE